MKTIIAAAVLAALIAILAPASAGATEVDHGLGYTPQPEATGATLSSPDYADVANKQRALNWRAFGLKYRPSLIRLCRITGAHPLPVWYPPRSRYTTWREYGNACKAWAVAVYRRERELYAIVAHPNGTGAARWWPLARYVGWPAAQRSAVILCIRLESGGRPWAVNGSCVGLMQVVGGSKDPRRNLAQGLRLWRSRGWQPWGPMTARGW